MRKKSYNSLFKSWIQTGEVYLKKVFYKMSKCVLIKGNQPKARITYVILDFDLTG